MVFLEIQYQHGCYLEIKKRSAFQCGEVSTKRKNVRVGQNDSLDKALFGLV